MSRRIDELTLSLRAERARPAYRAAAERREEQAERLRSQGNAGNRPGDRLHRALTGDACDLRPGDAEYLTEALDTIKAHKGDVLAIAGELDVSERTLRRWMGLYRVIGSAVRIAHLEAQLEAAKAAAV